MKMKLVLVLAVIALGCVAANAQTYTFGFLNYTGGVQYCEAETFTVYSGFLSVGTQSLSACGFSTNGTLVGYKTSIPAALGLPISGAGYGNANDEIDQFCACASGVALDWFTKTKASSKKYGWILFESSGGVESFDNYGYLTTALPSKEAAIHGSAARPKKN